MAEYGGYSDRATAKKILSTTSHADYSPGTREKPCSRHERSAERAPDRRLDSECGYPCYFNPYTHAYIHTYIHTSGKVAAIFYHYP